MTVDELRDWRTLLIVALRIEDDDDHATGFRLLDALADSGHVQIMRDDAGAHVSCSFGHDGGAPLVIAQACEDQLEWAVIKVTKETCTLIESALARWPS